MRVDTSRRFPNSTVSRRSPWTDSISESQDEKALFENSGFRGDEKRTAEDDGGELSFDDIFENGERKSSVEHRRSRSVLSLDDIPEDNVVHSLERQPSSFLNRISSCTIQEENEKLGPSDFELLAVIGQGAFGKVFSSTGLFIDSRSGFSSEEKRRRNDLCHESDEKGDHFGKRSSRVRLVRKRLFVVFGPSLHRQTLLFLSSSFLILSKKRRFVVQTEALYDFGVSHGRTFVFPALSTSYISSK